MNTSKSNASGVPGTVDTSGKEAEKQGVVYIAFGEKYRAECATSMKSLKYFHPDLPVCVITDREWDEDFRPEFVLQREAILGLRAKPRYISETPFSETLFLDTDTIVVNPISDVFQLLKYFDMGINFRPQFLRADPYFLPWCNSGVILFRSNERVFSAFARWLQLYGAAEETGADGRILSDRFLPAAIAESEARVIHLASALNFFLDEPQTTCSPLRIIHSRSRRDIDTARESTQEWDAASDWFSRTWLPQLKAFFPGGGLRSPSTWKKDPLIALSLLIRRILRKLK